MKTVVNNDNKILRVSDNTAKSLVENQGFRYIRKSIWKKEVRDVKIVPEAENLMKEEGGTFTVS